MFRGVNVKRLTTRIAQICTEEKIVIDSNALHRLVGICNHDIRYSLNTLQFLQGKVSRHSDGSGSNRISLSLIESVSSSMKDTNADNNEVTRRIFMQNHTGNYRGCFVDTIITLSRLISLRIHSLLSALSL